ncbi:lysozyme inhibitor LprI family protein [Pseudomonas syringae]|nr:lysozyme inhibitor LprI family protein [Pseudomonas syringae]
MRFSMMAVLMFMALGIGCSASAQNTDCDANQAAMNRCAGQQLAALDAELNKQYKAQIAYLQTPEKKQAFKAAQQKWIAFRDADCMYQAGKAEDSGSMWPLLQSRCLAEQTRVRVEQLKQYAACRQEGCPN